MDTVVNDLQFIGSDLTFINKLVHSLKKRQSWASPSSKSSATALATRVAAKSAFCLTASGKAFWKQKVVFEWFLATSLWKNNFLEFVRRSVTIIKEKVSAGFDAQSQADNNDDKGSYKATTC